MQELIFSPTDTVSTLVTDLTPEALAYAFAEAVGVQINVEIEFDYAGVWMTCEKIYTCIGEPEVWMPLENTGLTIPHVFARNVSLVNVDGATWTASSFNDGRKFSSLKPLEAGIQVIVYDYFGLFATVPRQLQDRQKLQQELLADRAEREKLEHRLDAEENLYTLGQP